jgi:HD-GYP domain-containing protein (c-di-GMP phosphodiesterase class II)
VSLSVDQLGDDQIRPSRVIHALVIKRLIIVWILLSLVVGAVIVYREMDKVDRQAFDLAMKASESLREHVTAIGDQHIGSLKTALTPLILQGYLQAQVSNIDGRVIAQASVPDYQKILTRVVEHKRESAHDKTESHSVIWLAKDLIVSVHIPFFDASRQYIGNFYGVYQVDPVTRQTSITELIRNVAVVLIVILVTTLTLYPVIIGLNKGVLRLSSKLMRSNIELMEVLGSAIAKRDSDTDLHNYRVCLYSIRFAEACGFSDQDIRVVITGAFLHDVGKIGISDTILLKPAKLSNDEFAIMKKHVQLGTDIIAKSSWLDSARDVVEFHHEHFDGGGYLAGLKGDSIPLAARLFAIVDVFDALTSHRPYKSPLPLSEALQILGDGRGRHFDPVLLAVFEKIAVELHTEISQLSEMELRKRLHGRVTDYFFERFKA